MNKINFLLIFFISGLVLLGCKKDSNIEFTLSVDNKSTMAIKVGDTIRLNVSPQKVKFQWLKQDINSNSFSIIGDSLLIGTHPGTETIIAYNEVTKISFTVVVIPYISSLSFKDTIVYAVTGNLISEQLIITPGYGDNHLFPIKWESLDTTIAKITSDNKIKILKDGETKIKVSTNYGNKSSSIRLITTNHQIYISGNSNKLACYWNLSLHNLKAGDYDVGAGYSIATSNGNLIIAGAGLTYFGGEAMYWNNEQQISLDIDERWSCAFGVAVDGTDIYFCGHKWKVKNNAACIWKNGNVFYLDSLRESWGSKIAISGNTICVGGEYTNSKGIRVACYWYNNIKTDLSDGTSNATVNSVFLDGFNDYEAGWYTNSNIQRACYWSLINARTKTDLTTGAGNANSIFVDNNNIYVAGDYNDDMGKTIACLWINGVKLDLTGVNLATSSAMSVKIVNGDVYVAGYYTRSDSKTVACCWINNRRIDLQGINGWAWDLVVK